MGGSLHGRIRRDNDRSEAVSEGSTERPPSAEKAENLAEWNGVPVEPYTPPVVVWVAHGPIVEVEDPTPIVVEKGMTRKEDPSNRD